MTMKPDFSDSHCSESDLIATMFKTMASSNHRNHTIRFRVTDQTESAIIYVAVVMIFYAAIIALLLGTSGKRHPRSRSRHRSRNREHVKKQTMAVYVDTNHQTEVVKTKQNMTTIDMNDDDNLTLL